MLSHQSSILRRTLPLATFNRLRVALGQMAQRLGSGTLILTEDVVSSLKNYPPQLAERFTVLVSEQFSALLTGTVQTEDGWQDPLTALYQVGLTFESEAIARFLEQLTSSLNNSSLALQALQQASLTLKSNDPTLQSEFTLSLLELLSSEDNNSFTQETVYPYVSVCQPFHEALRQQVEQERLLNQVTTQIRQSLELPAILKTAVEQVRSFLEADRLAIYQFEEASSSAIAVSSSEATESADLDRPSHSRSDRSNRSRITYEAKASAEIPSVLKFSKQEDGFLQLPDYQEKYRQGFTLGVEDTETAYAFSPLLLALMRRAQIRAQLVVPIVVQQELWGLLIAHQCFEPRQWQDNEKTFLRHIAEHLAIAIYQAQLYAQVQQQKQTLEQRVIERTQALHDTLLAAQSANRAKSEFLATMSHELRTPLTCVIGLSATLLRWSFGQLTQKQRDYLQTIHDNGEHLLELINDILDLSQVEAGKTVLNISEFSLSKMAHQTLQTLRDKAIGRGVDLKCELNIETAQDRFRADPKRVQQILLNLLSNAIKFTPEGGKVILRIWLEGNSAAFQVEDTGIGIPSHQQHLLFQKFQQLDTSYQRQYEGTGLGLALTKQLVELHRGRIEVESEVGVGSSFTVWLPRQPNSEMLQTPSDNARLLDSPHGRIALIENQEESATLICDILTAAGYQIVWIVEGSTAVKQIEILQPLVAIVDLNLPGMNGYDVIEQMRNLPTTKDLKILALTNVETWEETNDSLTQVADDYLTKPVQPDLLLQKVAALIVACNPSACTINKS